jgi:hypothetical protein
MVSAGFEHGGNVIHRHLDGHSNLFVYPFESQLGNRDFSDFLSSLERVQYRYPEFPEGLSAGELYEQIIDEEMKTFLRKRNGSKFREADLVLNESLRIKYFKRYLGAGCPYTRRQVVEAFFRSTFAAWENCCTKGKAQIYVGYSPAIGIDAGRIINDFPSVKIIHIVRNPFSAYRDTKRRPFPQSLPKYLITWNIYHSTVEMYAKLYPQNIRIYRYEDLVSNKKSFMKIICKFLKIKFEPCMLYPSWNGKELKNCIAPWGTVLQSTQEYNKSIISDLNKHEKRMISASTKALAQHFGYQKVAYVRKIYKDF